MKERLTNKKGVVLKANFNTLDVCSEDVRALNFKTESTKDVPTNTSKTFDKSMNSHKEEEFLSHTENNHMITKIEAQQKQVSKSMQQINRTSSAKKDCKSCKILEMEL